MDRGFDVHCCTMGKGQNTIGRGVDIPCVGGQHTMGMGFNIQWIGGQTTMGSGVDIPWVGVVNMS